MVTPNDTKGSLLRKIRDYKGANEKATGATLVAFGKYADKTYQEVRDNFPSYIKWVKEARNDLDCSVQLAKFAKWVDEMEKINPEKPKSAAAKRSKPEESAASRPSVSTSAAATATPAQPDQMTQMMSMMQQIGGAVLQMGARDEMVENREAMASDTVPVICPKGSMIVL